MIGQTSKAFSVLGFGGIYRYVSLYLVPDYLAQGWEIMAIISSYSVLMRAPIINRKDNPK